MKNLYVLIIAISFSLSAKSQIFKPVIWSYAAKRTSDNTATVFIKATIDNGWHIFSLNLPEGGLTKTIMSCDDKRCMPEETIKFAIPIKG